MKKIIITLICVGLAAPLCFSGEYSGPKTERAQRAYLESLDEFQWSGNLIEAACEACEDTYMTWDVEKVCAVSNSSARLIKDGTALSCSAVYTILLRGNIVGKRTCKAKVSVRGRYSFDNQGDLYFVLEETEILDGPATATDVADNIVGLIGLFLY